MKKSRLAMLGLAAVTGLTLLPSGGAQAASGTINVGGYSGVTVTRKMWTDAGCQASFQSNEFNGHDARIFDVSAFVARGNVRVSFTNPAPYGAIGVSVIKATGCSQIGGPSTIEGATSGAKTIAIPAGAKWIIVESFMKAQVAVTVS